jgi:AraC-like DNA-binding protein
MAKILRIAARPAKFVVDDLRRRRIATDKLLAEVGLRRADLADPETRVPYASVLALIERAARLVDDASYGLRLGAFRDQRDSGLIGFVLLNSPTLVDALTNVQRYFHVAHDVGMSSKTLARRLALQGKTFSGLLEDIRRDLTKRYLHETDFRLGQIAYLIGYSEPAALVRALRRWTGTTPIRFRCKRY